MSNLKTFMIFAAGAAVGSLITWKALKDKYEKRAQEEIDSVKEVWSKKEKTDPEEEPETDSANPNLVNTITRNLGYQRTDYSEISRPERESEKKDMDCPYVIPPENFGDSGYDTISLIYYKDEVLADDMDELVEDIDERIGSESLNHFGEYEDDVVFVRNDILKADYEISRDNRRYSDVVGYNVYGSGLEDK